MEDNKPVELVQGHAKSDEAPVFPVAWYKLDEIVPVALRELQANGEGEFVDPISGGIPPEDQCYTVNPTKALEPFLAKWVPLPMFAVLQPRANRPDEVDRGPANWVRARIVQLPPDPIRQLQRPARLTLAFDTQLMAPDPDDPGGLGAEESGTERTGPTQYCLIAT